MRPAIHAFHALVTLAAGMVTACSAASPPAPRSAESDAERQSKACAAGEEAFGAPAGSSAGKDTPRYGERIAAIRIEGARAVPESLIRDALQVKPGDVLDVEAVARDLRALEALEVFEDVTVASEPANGGSALLFSVAERPLVARVFVEGKRPDTAGTWFFPVAGDVYDPAAVVRARQALTSRLVRLGHLDAAARTHARRVDPGTVDLCLAFDAGPVYRVGKLAFTGHHVLSVEELRRALSESLPENERGKLNVEGGLYRAELLERAQLFLSTLAYERGLLRWETLPPEVEKIRSTPSTGSVEITFPLDEGPVFRISKIGFSGTLAAPKSTYDTFVDVLPGETFVRSKVIAVKQRADELHRRLGRENLVVNPATELVGDSVRIDFRVEVAR